jgi:hypothetical protein
MANFCPNCGEDITEKVKFCPKCGADISTFLKKSETPKNFEEKKVKGRKITEKTSVTDIIVYGVAAIIILILVAGLIDNLSNGSDAAESAIVSGANQGTLIPTPTKFVLTTTKFVPTPTESQTDRNIRIANEIVANYHKTHTYTLNDFYVCGDMASDVWDMLKTQGINAKITVGNVDKDITSFHDVNHAWVLAEVAPDEYLALEATGGYSVQITTNPRYYYGWSFYNPKQLKNYQQLLIQYNDAGLKYNSALNDYNAIVEQYNSAGLLTRVRLKSQVEDKALILQQRNQDLDQTLQQITALLSSL